jgi:protein-tyrosine-phosphatase
MNRFATWIASLPPLALCVGAVAADIDWSKVDQALGRKGSDLPGGVHKYGLPRSDLHVTVDGVAIKPALALGSWLAFQPSADRAMVMGDLVLTDTEISPVMQRLLESGVEITAIHNHLLRTSVPVFYMHVGGHGDPVRLAEALHAGLALSKTPLSQPPGSPSPAPVELDTAALEKILGYKGNANGGVYQFSVPRAEAVSEGGMAVPPSMGTATALNFQPTGGGKAAITGDFVLLGSEVTPVLKALRQHGVEVTALHSHMIDDSPHLFFMHFWANDDAQRLAQGLRAALDLANVKHRSQVVFVCEHGSVKSLVAASYFNRRAQERGLPFHAVARGVAPEPSVPGPVREGLRRDGFDISESSPQSFKASELDGAALVVSFDQDITKTVGGRTRHLRWDGLPDVLPDYSHGRDAIVQRVDALMDELAPSTAP